MRHHIIRLISALVLSSSVLLTPAAAAGPQGGYVLRGPHQALLGSLITVTVGIRTTDQAVNAVQGSVQFPQRMFTAEGITLSNSIIRYWQQQPTIDSSTGTISFTGGLPTPGFAGDYGVLFTFTGRTTAVGTARFFTTAHSILLANDTKGTILNTEQAALDIGITDTTQPPEPTPTAVSDNQAPTDLELAIGRDAHLFDHEWFAAFSAIDTGSGIDRYEIAETDPYTSFPATDQWRTAHSPIPLQNQLHRGKVFLKAVDKAGNEAVISRTFNPCPRIPWWLLALVLLCIGCMLYLARKHVQRVNKRINDKAYTKK